MANISYTLSRKQIAGKAEILVRFYHGRFDHRAKTGLYIAVQSWNATDGRCIISKRYETPANADARQVQTELDNLSAYLYERFTQTRYPHADWLQTSVLQYFMPQAEQAQPIADYIDAYCAARNVEQETRKKMQTLKHLLQEYGQTHPPITAKLTRKDLDMFFSWLLQSGERSENTARGRLRQLRTLLYYIGKPNPNPFDGYKISADAYGTPIYLTREELQFVAQYDGLHPRQLAMRDIFVFQCLTGCRVGDLIRLTPDNIRGEWLVYVPRKTSRAKPEQVEVPLTPQALQIVERWRGVDMRGRLLPFACTQTYNKSIHNILRACCCTRVVLVYNPLTRETNPVPLWAAATSHTARKTFAQMLYAATNDKRLVASLTGHSDNSQAFNRYSEVSAEMKQAAIVKGLE